MEPLRDRLRQLLTLLLEALDDSGDLELAAADARELAAAAGFDSADLDALQIWLRGYHEPLASEVRRHALRPESPPSDAGVRMLTGSEEEALTVSAFGYLVDLVHRGQITAAQMESLIQFAELTAIGPLAPGDLEPLLDHVLFAGGRRAGPWLTAGGADCVH